MARVIAFANQKGGVAKTTTTLNLGVALAEQGLRVLAVDLDRDVVELDRDRRAGLDPRADLDASIRIRHGRAA